MKTIYTQDFDLLTPGDLDGQDSWYLGPSHGGGIVSVKVGGLTVQCASVSTAIATTTNYERDLNSIIYPGQWHQTTFNVQVNSAMATGQIDTYADDSTHLLLQWDVTISAAGLVSIFDRSGTHVTATTLTLDAPHLVVVTVDENMILTVVIDAALVYTGVAGTCPYVGFGINYGGAVGILADVAYWDDIDVVLKDTGSVYKFFTGR